MKTRDVARQQETGAVSAAGPGLGRGIDTRFQLVEPDAAGLEALSGLVGRGLLRPHVARVFAAAHAAMEAGGFAGKPVCSVAD